MKFNTAALTLASAGMAVAAQPHHHAHHHLHNKRAPETDVVTVPGPTVIEYQLYGKELSSDDACKGIADGSLLWADGKAPIGACSSSTAAPTTTAVPVPTVAPAEFLETSTSTAPPPPPPTSTVTPPQPTAAPSSSSSSGATGVDTDFPEFPDGEIDCDTFPSQYGAVPLDYLGLGGFSGIQYVQGDGLFDDVLNAITSIVTAVAGEKCIDGAMCSYACAAGQQKSQWPRSQGSTGQSVGGLHCKNGKLYLTNKALSNKLCMPGVGGVSVKNTLGQQVSVCRTDYPGTESETIPLSAAPNEIHPLTCPDGSKYFQWGNKPTSAQYYVNNAGVGTQEGCQWGNGSQPIGNFAPLNLGVGQNNGKWLSIFQNSPTTTAKLDFNVKIQGSNLSGSCKYENGQYVSETGSNGSGCTVEVMSGDATFVFY